MLQVGDIIKIIYSKELLQMHLCELVNRDALTTKIVYLPNGRIKGAFVIPQSGRLRGEEWYIPIKSLESVGRFNRLRSLSIIKQTLL